MAQKIFSGMLFGADVGAENPLHLLPYKALDFSCFLSTIWGLMKLNFAKICATPLACVAFSYNTLILVMLVSETVYPR